MSGGPLPPTLPPTLDEASCTAERQRVIKKAMAVSQKRAADRLSAMREALYIPAAAGAEKEFRCSDSFTSLRYVVAGNFSVTSPVCNFVLVHDFFDTVEATALLMKHITSHHEGCQAVCFNYPGQSGTEWAHLGGAERARGAVEPVHNNDWIADRLHELLQHTEAAGEILLSTPFHLVGMGNGACVAAAFAQRWGAHPSYAHSLRSFVSVNGFLNPDPQLRAILHSAAQVALSASPTRPDIPVSFWTKFVFSDEYLKKVPRSLALHTYTAVSNLITNEGRGKIARGALQHRDVRGGLDPRNGVRTVVATVTADVGHAGGGGVDVDASGGVGESAGANASGSAGGGGATASTGASATTSASINAVAGASVSSVLTLAPVRVPVIVLQSTENLLVSPTHVDAFVSGRTTHHLFSHQVSG
jgi:pimeloyl-ACP methyl ester carboxylesterase